MGLTLRSHLSRTSSGYSVVNHIIFVIYPTSLNLLVYIFILELLTVCYYFVLQVILEDTYFSWQDDLEDTTPGKHQACSFILPSYLYFTFEYALYFF